jgi:hypothetical protein
LLKLRRLIRVGVGNGKCREVEVDFRSKFGDDA